MAASLVMMIQTLIDNDDWDDGWDDDQEVNRTQLFDPRAASTPYGEQYEMQTMQHEQSGLPDTSHEEIHGQSISKWS